MAKYVIKRLIFAVVVFLGVALFVFFLMWLTPSSPGRMILGEKASQELVDQYNEEVGYNDPFFVRYGRWVKDAVTKFDFGESYRTGQPVADEIASFFPITVRLAVYSLILTAIVGVPLGILAAVKQNTIVDNLASILAIIGSVVPSFVLALFLIRFFVLDFRIFPPNGADSFLSYVLPTLTCSVSGIAAITRMTRSTMLECIRQDYIRTARAKGCPERLVIWKHALKNSMPPILLSLGSLFAELLGGTVIAETVFVMPGIGTYLSRAISAKDMPAVMAGTTLLALLFSLVILATDISFAFLDPRIKAKYKKGGTE